MPGLAPPALPLRHDFDEGAFVDLLPRFLDLAEEEALRERLTNELAWEQREIVLFGRAILQPRLIAWAGDLPYRYSGQTLEPRPFAAGLDVVLERVRETTEVPFNHVLANRYRSGQDSMDLHADNEPELGMDPIVATVSLGATRPFVVVPRKKNGTRLRLELEGGSLLVMGGTCQRHYRHGVPKVPAATGERISLTFRHVRHAPRP